MIIRLHTSTGIIRVTAEPTDILHTIITNKIGNISYEAFLLNQTLNPQNTLERLKITHGAIIKVTHEIIKKEEVEHKVAPQPEPQPEYKRECNHEKTAMCLECLPKSPITQERSKEFCNHAENAMCSNCIPLSQWDFDYHAKAGIKYLSYASYKLFLKDSSQYLTALNYCKAECNHGSNEKCINCINKPIPITVPIYRMVDHIEIGCRESIERLIAQYKASGREVFGVLVGREEDYENIPGGVKIEVKGVYIPDQEGYPDGFVLFPEILEDLFKNQNKSKNKSISALHTILKKYDMKIVGCIYTCLGSKKIDSFLSASEVAFVSHLQNMNLYFDTVLNKNFNSKFVTLVLSKNEENIEINEVMVSEQGMALFRENLLSLTTNPNVLVSDERTFTYKKKNEYEVAIRHEEALLPTDYLIIRLTHGYKHNPIFNGENFDWNWKDKKASKYFAGDYSLQKFNNLDVLIWMKINKKLKNVYETFLDAIVNHKNLDFEKMCAGEEMLYFINAMRTDEMEWSCGQCTYLNHNSQGVCEMCEFPME